MSQAKLTDIGEVSLVRPPDPPSALNIFTTVVDGKIILDFGRAIWWVGFSPEQAQKLADDILGAVHAARTLHLPPGTGD